MAFLDNDIMNMGTMAHDLSQTDELIYEGNYLNILKVKLLFIPFSVRTLK